MAAHEEDGRVARDRRGVGREADRPRLAGPSTVDRQPKEARLTAAHIESRETTALADHRYLSLTTVRRDGTAVSTPVWCAGKDGHVLVVTEATSWKVKRIRRDPHVRVAPCSARGTVRGSSTDADASIVDDSIEVESLLGEKYGWQWTAYNVLVALGRRVRRRPKPRSVTLVITPR